MNIHALKLRVEDFLYNTLYSDKDNDIKYNEYSSIINDSNELEFTSYERYYILSELIEVAQVDMHTVPLLSLVCNRFIEIYNSLFKKK